VLLC